MRTAIISGHRSGLGEALTLALVEAGFAVLGLSRQHNPALAAACGERLVQVQLDLADSAAVLDWLSEGQLAQWLVGAEQAVLINNAGTVQPMGLLGGLEGGAQARAIALNVTAPLLLSDAFCRFSAHCPERRILHISSGAGRHPYPGWTTYCTSKAALDQHARAVAAEAHPGLRIESLAPGVIDTPMQSEIRAETVERFPLQARFVELHRAGQLLSPQTSAAQVLARLLSSDFGAAAVTDVRD